MANYTTQNITELRELTGMGLGDIKNALVEADGDRSKALAILKERGAKIMNKKADRAVGEGMIEVYAHGGRTGVILEINCETDFVSRSPLFKEFAHDLALQIASMTPTTIDELLEQPFVKDHKLTIGDYLREVTGKLGERIVVSRFVRYGLGESTASASNE